MSYDNEYDVLCQLEGFGLVLRDRDRPLRVDGARHTAGKGGKYWYKLHSFVPDAGGNYIVGSYGRYGKDSEKVVVDWTPLKEAERDRLRAKRKADDERAAAQAARAAEEAAMTAAELWSRGAKEGQSGYLQRKGVRGESCRYMPDGSILVPLIRYDCPRESALKGVQRIWPDGRKLFTKSFAKPGTAVRLGDAPADEAVPILFSEGFATGLSVRLATRMLWPLYVVLDCYNMPAVVKIVRGLYPENPMLLCADDDWRTEGNPGRALAKKTAKFTENCHLVYPVFPPTCARGDKDTDFNDLHRLAGLDVVAAQIGGAVHMMQRYPLGR